MATARPLTRSSPLTPTTNIAPVSRPYCAAGPPSSRSFQAVFCAFNPLVLPQITAVPSVVPMASLPQMTALLQVCESPQTTLLPQITASLLVHVTFEPQITALLQAA